uniref:Eukaryotic translation initiation factor 3 subunit F n=1 Tax=Isotomurus palustris TaxID=36144 RepID=A0A481T040_9HEXA|nr:eukaryotic translation initiation factor 3 subunit F [Isotomurus palustris]
MVLNLTVKVHPVVLFQIVNAYERRNLDRNAILGTLLGTIDKNSVEVTNCFVVPHSISPNDGTVSIEMHIADTMYKLNKQVHPSEVIVGWWATGFEVTSIAVPINDYYSRQCANPVHLLVDTTLRTKKMAIKSFVQVDIGVPEGSQGAMFSPVPVEVIQYAPEAVAMRTLVKTRVTGKVEPRAELPQVAEAIDELEEAITVMLQYVEDVLNDRTTADNSIGRNLLKLVQAVPNMTRDELDNMMSANIKDLLMAMYLSQLTRVQAQLNEKLLMTSNLVNPNN